MSILGKKKRNQKKEQLSIVCCIFLFLAVINFVFGRKVARLMKELKYANLYNQNINCKKNWNFYILEISKDPTNIFLIQKIK